MTSLRSCWSPGRQIELDTAVQGSSGTSDNTELGLHSDRRKSAAVVPLDNWRVFRCRMLGHLADRMGPCIAGRSWSNGGMARRIRTLAVVEMAARSRSEEGNSEVVSRMDVDKWLRQSRNMKDLDEGWHVLLHRRRHPALMAWPLLILPASQIAGGSYTVEARDLPIRRLEERRCFEVVRRG